MKYENTARCLLMSLLVAFFANSMHAQKPSEFLLWPKGAPHQSANPQDTAKVTIYLPAKKAATGRAIVICPGGGYQFLAMDHEGHDWAPFFNQEGIAVVVLKYRMPHGDFPVATHADGKAKPDFQILFYPVITMQPDITHKGSHDALLGSKAKKKEEREFSNDEQVTRATPRAWIALSDDDHTVLPANGANYYVELYRHDVPASLHIYPTGGHGWGMLPSFRFHIEMLLELRAWLKSF